MMQTTSRVFLIGALAHVALMACHPDPKDPVGQVKELKDPARRQNAIFNLSKIFSASLRKQKGNRNSKEVRALRDTIAGPLSQMFVEHPEDTSSGLAALDLMVELRDPRTLPAALKALEWREEVSEEQAIRAARIVTNLEVPAAKAAKVAAAIGKAYSRIRGSRKVDNRMRKAFIDALASLESTATLPTLAGIALSRDSKQDFLFNRLALQAVADLGAVEALDVLKKGLFIFAPGQPAFRANDIADAGLTRLGKKAFKPALDMLTGRDAEALALAKTYLQAVATKDAGAAAQMSPAGIVADEAIYLLGALGIEAAFDPLMTQVRQAEPKRQVSAAVALARLGVESKDRRASVSRVLTGLYRREQTSAPMKARLMIAMRHTYDASLMQFFLSEAENRSLPFVMRGQAIETFALLSNKPEAIALQNLIAREPKSQDGGYRENLLKYDGLLKLAKRCNENRDCWTKQLRAREPMELQKSANMLARLSRGDTATANALVPLLAHSQIGVRMAAAAAIDHIAVRGCPQAVEKIAELQSTEAGRGIWRQFSGEALTMSARLKSRAETNG